MSANPIMDQTKAKALVDFISLIFVYGILITVSAFHRYTRNFIIPGETHDGAVSVYSAA